MTLEQSLTPAEQSLLELGEYRPVHTRAGREPELQKAPAEVHTGAEATGDVPESSIGRFTRNLAEKVAPSRRLA